MERPLFAVAVRLAASSPDVLTRLERSFLSQFQSVENGLEAIGAQHPLRPVLGRFTQTPGMLLNTRELAALVHLPDPSAAPGAPVILGRESPAPEFARRDVLIPLGVNRYRGVETPVGIPSSWLPMHVAIFGVPGSGKSNLLTWFLSVVEAGYGLAFLDPAGDTAEWFLRLIPEKRVNDVIYFNPGDREHPPALNVLEASNRREKEMLAVELLVSLKRLFHRSGELTPRMERILRQSIRALILSEGEKTILDIRRLLRDSKYRASVIKSTEDPDLVEFWQNDFARMPQSAVDPILNRLAQFFEDPLVRNVVTQPNLIDFYQVLNEGKILVCNLSKGIIGEEAATLLGSFILSRLQLATMARAEMLDRERNLFPILVDEFQNYAGVGMDTS
ncbi:MAG: ATP-binding protein, partial [Chloroflexi bacterium]|nr:ATP-binding protein [Chloroflexota bacterium]